MSKLPPLTSRKFIKILKSLGFKLDHTTGSHFIFYNSQTKKRAVVPFHKKDLPKGTLMSILKEARISKEDIKKLIKKK
jgi:predicted RNA binding protein YcfA (HicA-like mRNA interferase family)